MIAWFAGQPLPTQIGLAILAGALLPGLAMLSYFRVRKFLELKALKDLEVKDRVGLKIEFIKTAAQILGGAFFLVTIYVAWQNLIVSQEKHTTDLYTKAIEQLGSKQLEVRLGGIYALERIARDSEKDHWPIMEVLTAYVRENAPWPPEEPAAAKKKRPWAKAKEQGTSPPGKGETNERAEIPVKPDADVQAILTVIGRRNRTFAKRETQPLDLGETDLRGADPWEAHLEGAILWKAHLEKAILPKTHLEGAILSEAHLERAIFDKAHLQEADFRGANLNGSKFYDTNLGKANLQKASLKGAYLGGAINLTREQLAAAIIDDKTTLPDYLIKPAPDKSGSK